MDKQRSNMMTNWPKDSGRRIRNLRKAKGMTQEQLANELHISANHLRKVEIGVHTCSLELYMDIAAFFDVSLDFLIRGKEDHSLKERINAVIRELSTITESI